MNKKLQKNIFIIISFIILSVIFIYALLKSGHYLMMADSSFHLSRANEIYQNLKHGGLFTFIATHCFSQSGVGTFLFYPSVFIYPLALLRFIFNPITSIWLWVGMFLFLTLLISFYSMLSFSKENYRRSYLFAILYTIVPYHLYLGIWNGTFGEFIAYTFLPLVFLGLYKILWEDSDKWYILAVGITLVCYSHILSLYISVGFCLIVFIIKLMFSSINKQQFISLVKAAMLTILLTLWQFVPFITDYLGNNIVAPNEVFQFPYGFNDLLNNSFSNIANWNGRTGIGVCLIVVLLVGWAVPVIQQNKKELIIYSLGTLILLCSTTFLAWQAFGSSKLVLHTLGNIQMTFRLLPYGSLFLAVTASFALDNYIDNLNLKREGLLLGIFTLLSIGGYYGSIQYEIQILYNVSKQNKLYPANSFKPKAVINCNAVASKQSYNDIFGYQIIFGETDYYNKKAIGHSKSIINNWTYINGKKQIIKKTPGINKIVMRLKGKQGEKADLPIIAYHDTYVVNNDLKVNYTMSKRGTVQIRLHNGINNITVGYKPNICYYTLFIVAIAGWIIFAILRIWVK